MKFSPKAYPPSFFDLTQDISKDLPVDIIKAWTNSDQSGDIAKSILEKTKVRGTLISSDSSGLTKMSQHMGLIELLAKINQPKELVYSFGTHIGGEGVGIWAADNTEMFYPESVSTESIINMLNSIKKELLHTCDVKISLAAHFGEFYSLGGGMYGNEADWIENIAEDQTEGGEIVISEHLLEKFKSSDNNVNGASLSLIEREDLQSKYGKIFRLEDGQMLADIPKNDPYYPIPYSKDFYEDLIKFNTNTDEVLLKNMYEKYVEKLTVVLIEREREEEIETEDKYIHEVRLLNDLALSVVMKKAADAVLSKYNGTEIKTAGPLGIYVFKESQKALDFAKELKNNLLKDGVSSKTGIDYGELLVFTTPDGHKDIAGMPVNQASKMAQDKGEFGHIYMSAEVAKQVNTEGFSKTTIEVSRVTIDQFVM